MNYKNDFEFNYVALSKEEKKEIESIRNSYISKDKESTKLEYLRKLDNKVKNLPSLISLVFGIVSSLIFGLGLAMILEWNIIIWGILVMSIGFVLMLVTYPLHVKIISFLKNKYSKEILKISEELLYEEN